MLILILYLVWLGLHWGCQRRSRRHRPISLLAPTEKFRHHPKPPWVAQELIRIKVWSPELGCRMIAEVFNRQFSECNATVGKTYVANVLRRSRLEILRMRRTVKHRIPRPIPINRIWGMDLTMHADLTGHQHLILGVLDHGSRACLRLSALADKRSVTILRELLPTFRRYGIPQHIRVDNEACFNARLLKTALTGLGIRLQTIEPHCPWQNGRIERFFGTFKQALNRVVLVDGVDLATKLIEFRAWYNHVRPHQHLSGCTPAEVWDGRMKSIRKPQAFVVWEGQLTGWYFPP